MFVKLYYAYLLNKITQTKKQAQSSATRLRFCDV
nr:MAG TPA: hypothetical protein [Caudoviricetes sp.]